MGANLTETVATELYPSEFVPSFTVSADAVRESVIFGNEDYGQRSIEETVAHIIWYAKNLVEEHDTAGGGKHKIGSLKDLVITVPGWASQRERQAIMAAGAIAGFPRVSLVHETTSAGVQRGFDLELTLNGTREVTTLFLNMGATHFESCVVQYGLAAAGTPTTRVLGCAHSLKAGGSEITAELAREASKFFVEKHPSKKADFDKDMVAAVRIFRQAEAVKHTLSANKEAQFSVESLLDEIDLRKPFTRADVERAAQPVLTEIELTISKALEKAGIAKSEIAQVEVIGGGWRVPCVQAKLEETFAPILLGQHLNGDESIVFGGAFIAANASSTFRVRKTWFTDIIDSEYSLTVSADAGGQEWPKTQTIFPSGHKLNSVKAIKLSVDADLRVDLKENGNLIESFEISGRNASAFVSPQVILKLKLDSNGLVSLLNADALYEYQVEQQVKTPIVRVVSNDTQEVKEGADGEEGESATSAPVEPPPEFNVTTITVPKKDKVTLKVKSVFQAKPLPMSEEDIKATKAKLKRFVDEEDRIKLKTKVRNDLESLIYSVRDKMQDDKEVLDNSSSEEREHALQTSRDVETWFDDNAWTGAVEDFKNQIQFLTESTKPIYDRIQEKKRAKELEELAAKLAEELARQAAMNATSTPETEEETTPVPDIADGGEEEPDQLTEEQPTEVGGDSQQEGGEGEGLDEL